MNLQIEKTLQEIKKGEKKLTIWWDIDGTLCSTDGKDYDNAEPDEAMITLLNSLYDHGHTIYIVTARGASSGINWKAVTKHQLQKWGVKYHKLIMGYSKDLFVDDVCLRPEEFLNEVEI